MGARELIEKAERIAAMGTRGPLGSGFADDGEGKLVWSDGRAGQLVATCATKADAEKFVAAVELLPALAAELARLTTPRPSAEAPQWLPLNADTPYGEPPREVLVQHLRQHGGLWLVEDSAGLSCPPTIFRTWQHPTEDRICWADARGEALFSGRVRPLLFAPLGRDFNRLPLPEVKP